MRNAEAKQKRVIWTAVIVCAAVLLATCNAKDRQRSYSNLVMGTFCELKFTPVPGVDSDKIAKAVFGRMQHLEDIWSLYKEESEISQLNRTGRLKPSKETLDVLKKSLEVSRLSNGAFDITVAPLIAAWRKSERTGKLPDFKSLVPLVGYQKVLIAKDGTVRFAKKDMAIDLGGIGKGAAVDEAVSLLKYFGVKSGMVNLGGNIYAFGEGPHQDGQWIIGIQNPRGNGTVGTISVKNQGISTSGNYRQYFEVDGKRYSHILNPETGRLPNYPESVTVIAPDAALADGLSTAFTVMGPGDAISLAKKIPGVEVLIIRPGEKNFRTKGFPPRFSERKSYPLTNIRSLTDA